MIRTVLALLLLLLIAGFSGEARAHAGMVGHGPAAGAGTTVTDAAALTEAAAVLDDADPSPGHLPAGKCCMTVVGCGSAGSILADAPLLPAPERVATVERMATLDAPRGHDLPVADRPPRPA